MTLEEIKEMVSEGDPGLDPTDEAYKTQVILLTSAVVGPNIKRIAKFTGYPRAAIAQRGANWRAAGIWDGGKVIADNWDDPDKGWLGFILQSMVGDGILEARMS